MKAKKCPLFIMTIAALLLLAAAQIALPDRTVSQMESRTLSSAPKLSLESVLSSRFMSSCESYIADQIPLRDAFVSAYAVYESAQQKQLRNGVLIGENGYMFEMGKSISEKNIRENAEAFAEIARAAGASGYICVSPLSSSVYGEYVPRYAPIPDGYKLESAAKGDGITAIPLLKPLIAKKGGDALYYKTDHHWTAQGAYAAYSEICAAMGLENKNDGRYYEREGFSGSYFARSPSPLQVSDTLTYFEASGTKLIIDGKETPEVNDSAALGGRDKYSGLLCGNHALIKLTNDNAGGVLFVLRDSYANALLPYLSQNFGTIYAVDARYYTGDIISEIRKSNADALLCLYGINTLGESRDLITLAADALEEE
ncbi:MAG: DHHW family protein [Eubacteriales bacterium]|nr:DHHW family protein [Eubacteriales bacterium]MDD3881595.1 DHHW family protein [Eubacteriales bacterium]MDD4512346.1 DHHW family protein [Eubacteriales bacterium]